MSEQQPTKNGTGFLVVQVTTANSAIPLEGAEVRILDKSGGNVIYELKSDRSGKTPRVSLPTVPRSTSLTAGSATPYTPYHIEVTLAGYGPLIFNNVPIFDGITAIQQADLVPTPDNQYPDGFSKNRPQIFEGRSPTL